MIAPEPFLSAYLGVLRSALLEARRSAWSKEPHEKLADLMDAVHNIPELLNHWETCIEPCLRESLELYDRKWFLGANDLSLCSEFYCILNR